MVEDGNHRNVLVSVVTKGDNKHVVVMVVVEEEKQ